LLGKLAYLDELRADAEQHYAHWGLERKFGKSDTQQALEQVHIVLARALVNSRLAPLLREVGMLRDGDEFPQPCRQVLDNTLHAPEHVSRAEAAHFQVTLETLRELATAPDPRDA
jgi:hypothetical protein